MTLKEFFKERLLNGLFEQNNGTDYDSEIETERRDIAKRTQALVKAQSQSEVSGLDPLNDRMPYKGGPADYYSKSMDYPAKSVPEIAKAMRHPMSSSAKMQDPLGLKTTAKAIATHRALKSGEGFGGQVYPFETQDRIHQGEYENIGKRYDNIRDLELQRYVSGYRTRDQGKGPR